MLAGNHDLGFHYAWVEFQPLSSFYWWPWFLHTFCSSVSGLRVEWFRERFNRSTVDIVFVKGKLLFDWAAFSRTEAAFSRTAAPWEQLWKEDYFQDSLLCFWLQWHCMVMAANSVTRQKSHLKPSVKNWPVRSVTNATKMFQSDFIPTGDQYSFNISLCSGNYYYLHLCALHRSVLPNYVRGLCVLGQDCKNHICQRLMLTHYGCCLLFRYWHVISIILAVVFVKTVFLCLVSCVFRPISQSMLRLSNLDFLTWGKYDHENFRGCCLWPSS